ncbi:molecular chaperone [Halobacteriovorax sp. HLS]|uniref:fimbrial biogenesis chaperone n=1 Tax=Halobacteriovorax sp. HLS TaxID=2234000 RepID=UPI000FD73312|nr:fimbria/pilus periplasmic chaperone [Halobacteriovorax sp. HLS]
MKNSIIIILCSLFSLSIHAFKLSPMSYSIIGGGKNNIANFTVSNDGETPIAVQLEVKVRDMLSDGSEKLPETEDFLVFPDQLVLGPKSRRVVKVRWLKGEVEDFERSFRLIAEQLPIDLNKKKGAKTDIKILLRYVAALYVTPSKAQSNISVVKSSATKDLKKVLIDVRNDGNLHLVLSSPKITFTQEGKDFLVENYEGILGENILTRSNRKFLVTPPSLVNIQKPFKVRIKNND